LAAGVVVAAHAMAIDMTTAAVVTITRFITFSPSLKTAPMVRVAGAKPALLDWAAIVTKHDKENARCVPTLSD